MAGPDSNDNKDRREEKTADYGFQTVPRGKKQDMVGSVFDRVARRYDVMNDLMSAGTHPVVEVDHGVVAQSAAERPTSLAGAGRSRWKRATSPFVSMMRATVRLM